MGGRFFFSLGKNIYFCFLLFYNTAFIFKELLQDIEFGVRELWTLLYLFLQKEI